LLKTLGVIKRVEEPDSGGVIEHDSRTLREA
jgi:hypothetical protein